MDKYIFRDRCQHEYGSDFIRNGRNHFFSTQAMFSRFLNFRKEQQFLSFFLKFAQILSTYRSYTVSLKGVS